MPLLSPRELREHLVTLVSVDLMELRERRGTLVSVVLVYPVILGSQDLVSQDTPVSLALAYRDTRGSQGPMERQEHLVTQDSLELVHQVIPVIKDSLVILGQVVEAVEQEYVK